MEQIVIENFINEMKANLTSLSEGKQIVAGNFINEMNVNIESLEQEKQRDFDAWLNNGNLEHIKTLEEFLPELQIMKERVTDELKNIVPTSMKLKGEMEGHYICKNKYLQSSKQLNDQISHIEEEISMSEIDIKTEKRKINDLENDIYDLKIDLQSKLKYKDELIPQLLIPFYNIWVATEITKTNEKISTIENNIYSKEDDISRCNQNINRINIKIYNYLCQKEIRIQEMNSHKKNIEDLDKKIEIIHQQICNQIKNMTYLTILEDRVIECLTHGKTDLAIMKMLDMEPEDIKYDDQVYFELLETWNKTRDDTVLKKFIMKTEEEFFKNM